jgi:hypothetical protein
MPLLLDVPLLLDALPLVPVVPSVLPDMPPFALDMLPSALVWLLPEEPEPDAVLPILPVEGFFMPPVDCVLVLPVAVVLLVPVLSGRVGSTCAPDFDWVIGCWALPWLVDEFDKLEVLEEFVTPEVPGVFEAPVVFDAPVAFEEPDVDDGVVDCA